MATTSRYATAGTAGSSNNPTSSSTSSNSGGTKTESGSQSSTSQQNSVKYVDTATQNMSPQNLAALNLLIRQLEAGGTKAMQLQNAQRQQEIGALNNQATTYSKDNAFNDASGLMSQTLRQTLEKLLPGINAGAVGAGTSASSARALLMQKSAENAAEAAAAQGLQAAVNYGGIANGAHNTLSTLLSQQDPVTAALLAALGVAKGSVANTKGTETTNVTGSSSQQAQNTTVTNQIAQEDKAIGYGGNVSTTSGGVFNQFSAAPMTGSEEAAYNKALVEYAGGYRNTHYDNITF